MIHLPYRHANVVHLVLGEGQSTEIIDNYCQDHKNKNINKQSYQTVGSIVKQITNY